MSLTTQEIIAALKKGQVNGIRLTVSAPFDCTYCPFGASTREPYHEIANDTSEAHYICPVLDKDVWGEDPECSPALTNAVSEILQ